MALFALAFATLPLIPVTPAPCSASIDLAGFGASMLAEVAVKLGLGALAVWMAGTSWAPPPRSACRW